MDEKKREYHREYQRRWYAEHREEVNAKRRAYYHKNRDRCRSYSKKYNDTHREQHREYCRQYYHDHKDDPEYKAKDYARHLEWQKKNKDKWNAYLREYRKARKMKGGAE